MLPFIFYILLIATLPNLLPKFWHKHYKIISWLFIAFTITNNLTVINDFQHIMLYEYLPFIIIIFSQFIITSGIYLKINAQANKINLIIFLILGSLTASIIGTSGASLLLIRPFIKIFAANQSFYIFFILIISNIGGVLTPIGDPPLLLGFLNGIDFFWPLENLWLIYLFSILFLSLAIILFTQVKSNKIKEKFSWEIKGSFNFVFLFLLIVILVGGKKIGMPDFYLYTVLLALAGLSYYQSSEEIRKYNNFSLAPFYELSIIFCTIFITLVPCQKLLSISEINLTTTKIFWYSGLMSAVLDNAPTYLLFFKMIDPYSDFTALKALSVATVYMGGLTYIGNAPNLLVKSIVEQHKIAMPSFGRYLLIAASLLLPLMFFISFLL